MRKIQQLAKILSVEIPESLQEWNEDNDAQRARLNFQYTTTANDIADGEDEEARSLLGSVIGGQIYSVAVDLSEIDGNETEDKRANLEAKLKGKKVTFTTFVEDVAKLLEGTSEYDGVVKVNNESRDYSTLSESYLGKNDDEKAVFVVLQARLLRQLEEEKLFPGSIADSKSKKNRRLRVAGGAVKSCPTFAFFKL